VRVNAITDVGCGNECTIPVDSVSGIPFKWILLNAICATKF